MRGRVGVAMATVLLATSCSSSGLGDLETSMVESTDHPTTTASSGPVEVTADGATVILDDGTVIVPAGALPAGATLTVTALEADTDTAPPGTIVVGSGMVIDASDEPAAPVILEFPVREGETTDDLYLLHFLDDGSYELNGGSVTDGVFTGAVRSFSAVYLVHHNLTTEWALLPDIDLPTLRDGDPMPDFPGEAEAYRLATGQIDDPIVRAAYIVGPGEMRPGSEAVFVAEDFIAKDPEFISYEWEVLGGPGAQILSTSGPAARVAGTEPGRYLVAVTATDPLTGASAFATRRVFVTADGFAVWAVPNADQYCCGRTPVITIGADGGAPPIFVEWEFSPGRENGSVNTPAMPWETSVVGPSVAVRPWTLTVTAIDATDTRVSTAIVLPGGPWDEPTGMVIGPLRVPVGEPATFTALIGPDAKGRRLRWSFFPAPAWEGQGASVTATWSEPAIVRIELSHPDEDHDLEVISELVIVVYGDAEPVEAAFATAPTDLTVGEEAVWTVQGMGGVIAPVTGFWGYQADIDFGDGTTLSAIDLAATTATMLTDPVEAIHAYEEPGDYTVTLTVTDADGASAVATTEVTVLDRLVAEGEFLVYDDLVPVEVVANRFRLVIEAGEVRIRRFEFSTIMPRIPFDLASGETFEATCHLHSDWQLESFEGTYDATAGTITGTATVLWDRLDVGTFCPFGGVDALQERFMRLEATVTDGLITGFFTADDDVLPENVGLGFEASLL